METEEQIYRDVTFSLDIPDDIYQQATVLHISSAECYLKCLLHKYKYK